MSNIERHANVQQIIKVIEPDFNQLAKIHNAVNYEREASYALQILNENSYVATCAMSNQDSFKRAIINIAATGLSLDPVKKFAYLVPRKNKVCLDISYVGMIHLAIQTGGIKWAQAELVYENDQFVFMGVGHEPVHKFDPFSDDRGKFRGGYVVAKTTTDEFIVTMMSEKELNGIRERSEAYKKNIGPWITDRDEMYKKTVIKRAYKMWPKTSSPAQDRLDKAIDVSNDANPLEEVRHQTLMSDNQRLEKFKIMRENLALLNASEKAFIEFLRQFLMRDDIFKLEELTDLEIEKALQRQNEKLDSLSAKNRGAKLENNSADKSKS